MNQSKKNDNPLFIFVIILKQILSLWTVSDRKYGGLSFSSKEIGQVLAIAGIFISRCNKFYTTITATICFFTIPSIPNCKLF
jgi:hypothetical protein